MPFGSSVTYVHLCTSYDGLWISSLSVLVLAVLSTLLDKQKGMNFKRSAGLLCMSPQQGNHFPSVEEERG